MVANCCEQQCKKVPGWDLSACPELQQQDFGTFFKHISPL